MITRRRRQAMHNAAYPDGDGSLELSCKIWQGGYLQKAVLSGGQGKVY